MPINERTTNGFLLRALMKIAPKWKGVEGVEETGLLEDHAKQPDLCLTSPGGHPVIIETEYSPANTVDEDAISRLGETYAKDQQLVDVSIAVKLPTQLGTGTTSNPELFEQVNYEFAVFSRTPDATIQRWPESGYCEGKLRDLANFIDHTSISDRALAEGANLFEKAVTAGAGIIERQSSMGLKIPEERIAKILKQEASTQTTYMAMAIITNAIVFYEVLSTHLDLDRADQDAFSLNSYAVLLKEWDKLVQNINYWPIFNLASKLLRDITRPIGLEVVEAILPYSSQLARLGTTSLYDLSGQMFQTLIADRKFLATFYTLPSSAALLAEIALSQLSENLTSAEKVAKVQIADLACGTGTLLCAAYRSILRKYQALGLDDADIHATMVENNVIAADIMPAATHMTAAQILSFHPAEQVNRTRIYTMPYGPSESKTGRDVSLGTLDLMSSDTVNSLFGTGSEELQVNLRESVTQLDLPNESLDLVIMNPPFTRPTNHKRTTVPVPSFAGLANSEDEQRLMSQKLKTIKRTGGPLIGNGNAGLASNFFDLAHMKTKPGGVIALVLPITALSGSAWSGLRDMLDKHYLNVIVVSIASGVSLDRSFSADTNMAECLIVAKKKTASSHVQSTWRFLTLRKRPFNLLEAMEIARRLPSLNNQLVSSIRIGDDEIGHHFNGQSSDCKLVGLQSSELARFFLVLQTNSEIWLRGQSYPIPLTKLEKLGTRGKVDRDVGVTNMDIPGHRAPFKVAKGDPGYSQYPLLWAHDHTSQTRLFVEPDSYGEVISGREHLIGDLWNTASRLHLSLDFSTVSHALTTSMTENECLGGRAWPNFSLNDKNFEKFLVLWLNSTLGIMLRWSCGSKQHVGRSLLTISTLESISVLDPRSLTIEQLSEIDSMFDYFKTKDFLPAAQSGEDPTRLALDEFVLTKLCKLPNEAIETFDLIRRAWCTEPIIRGK